MSDGPAPTGVSDDSFVSGGLRLSRHLVVPHRPDAQVAVLMCHGFPAGPLDARRSGGTFAQLIDRIADDLGIAAMNFNFRGTGTSEGDFSLQGWIDDLRTAAAVLVGDTGVSSVVAIGTETGGSLAVCVGAAEPRIGAVAAMSPRATFDEWGDHPRRFLEQARTVGAVRGPRFPASFEEWSRGFRRFRPLDAARRFAPRPLLVLHGADDEIVPANEGRQLAHAHGTAELRVLEGGDHRLRHDPRAIAVLLGWLDRTRDALRS